MEGNHEDRIYWSWDNGETDGEEPSECRNEADGFRFE